MKRTTPLPRRIYILGAGNLGCFVAHALAGIPQRPPITLLLQRPAMRLWKDTGSRIDVSNHGMTETRRGFEVEVLHPLDDPPSVEEKNPETDSLPSMATVSEERILGVQNPLETSTAMDGMEKTIQEYSLEASNPLAENTVVQIFQSDTINPRKSVSDVEPQHEEKEMNARLAGVAKEVEDIQATRLGDQDLDLEESEEIIFNLIVSVKAAQTVKAIQRVAHRLTNESTIMFLQNGMGMIDEVNGQLFPDEDNRPTYVIGVVTHGLYSNGSFSVVHAGEGTIALGAMPQIPPDKPIEPKSLSELATSTRYLIRTMTRTPVFVAVGFPPTDLLQQQLDKLAVNCIINPLTAIIDCKNGALLSNMYFTRVVRLLLAEISIVIKSMPELKNVPNVNMRFDTLRLERYVFSIANKTAENYSSMLQDVRLGRLTEIDYLNGYIIRRGEEMGIHCVTNYMLMHMVKAKNKIQGLEKAELLPLAGRRSGR